VSNSTDVVVPPRRTVTSAEKPCSAISPVLVRPVSNWGAAAVPDAIGARVIVVVVDQRGDDHLVGRLQYDRFGRAADGRVRHRGADLADAGRVLAHGCYSPGAGSTISMSPVATS